ncbi:MAG: recombinase RecA, partial [Thermoplasmata archaeon]|nr:recombinase RecA [Thermoplasmata archaeon]
MSEEVICPKCGGVIDPKTLKCSNCGTKYSREEYEELKKEVELKSWLVGRDIELDGLLGEVKAIGEEKKGELLKNVLPEKGVDVDSIIQENLKLKSMVEAYLEEREKLEEEIERLKKEIEILKEESVKGLPQDVRDLKLKEIELKEREIKLEIMEKKLLLSMESKESYEELEKIFEDIKKNVSGEKIEELMEKMKQLSEEIMEKDRLIGELKNELMLKEEEMRKLQEMIKYKEEELSRREEEILFREKKLEKELRDIEMARKEVSNLDEIALKRRLEELEEEIKKKEEEIRIKEKYLRAKERELEAKMKGLVEEEVELAEEEIKAEIQERKVKTGTRRLDDLLYGGFPIGSNVLIYGPPYSKKEVLVYSFIAEGLRKGVPALLILTDKTVDEIREDMKYVLPAYREYEKLGLVYYIDAYSRSIGDINEIEGVIYLDSQVDVDGMMRAVEEIVNKIKENVKYYRFAFMSLSTVMAYLEPQALLRFLQPFTTRRKRDGAVSL